MKLFVKMRNENMCGIRNICLDLKLFFVGKMENVGYNFKANR